MLCKLDKFLYSLYRYSGYLASFFLILILVSIVLGITSRIFGFYIRGLTEYSGYSLASASFLALAYYLSKMWLVSIELEERSQGADEILLWIPQTGVAVGSIIFFICILHNFLKIFIKRKYD